MGVEDHVLTPAPTLLVPTPALAALATPWLVTDVAVMVSPCIHVHTIVSHFTVRAGIN